MITGICNAYFDSVPVLFITGQVNTTEAKGNLPIRQRGFQETDIVSMVADVTKYAAYVEYAEDIEYHLEKAYQSAMSGRKGPVLLDIPMNIQRTETDVSLLRKYPETIYEERLFSSITMLLEKAKRPCLLLGAGCKGIPGDSLLAFVDHMDMPVVTSMIAVDLLPASHRLNFGFVGAYGDRAANFVIAKSDFVLVLGSRLDVRQVGGKREQFAPNAQIVRVDIDPGELKYQIRKEELDICADVKNVMTYLSEHMERPQKVHKEWIEVCHTIAFRLKDKDIGKYNRFVEEISKYVPENTIITTDVGQNQVWIAQSFQCKENQRILFSGGHGAMGYSLPAAIGAYYATKRPVISFNGDGGFQMNIQELEFIHRENIPVKIFVFNNNALGMIRHFQEMYFDSNYVQTVSGHGYSSPNLKDIAMAYGLKYICYTEIEDVNNDFMKEEGAVLIEIVLKEDTYVFPKLEFGKPNQDQEPLLDRKLFAELMEL